MQVDQYGSMWIHNLQICGSVWIHIHSHRPTTLRIRKLPHMDTLFETLSNKEEGDEKFKNVQYDCARRALEGVPDGYIGKCDKRLEEVVA